MNQGLGPDRLACTVRLPGEIAGEKPWRVLRRHALGRAEIIAATMGWFDGIATNIVSLAPEPGRKQCRDRLLPAARKPDSMLQVRTTHDDRSRTMLSPRILIGGESFRELREGNYAYIDKTALLEELLGQDRPKVALITRPRRFGKTLTMSMLHEFFDIQKNSESIFKGLAIVENKAFCRAWMNKFPTVFISFKEISGRSFSHSYDKIVSSISEIFFLFKYLLKDENIDDKYKEKIHSFIDEKIKQSDAENSLLFLCKTLNKYWNKKVVILIDEYDAPLFYAEQKGFYDEMIEFMRHFLGAALKGNDCLELAVMTGCLRVAKESIFTGINNFECYGISDHEISDKIGFTDSDVDSILFANNLEDKKYLIKEWYDGYTFGNTNEMYCPWDVLRYVKKLKNDKNALPESFWINSSSNDIIRKMIDGSTIKIRQKIEKLIALECIDENISEYLTYDSLYIDDDNIWSILYSTGYLTKSRQETKNKNISLKIPNKEVLEIFIQTIKKWIKKIIDKNISSLLEAFWEGDEESVENILNAILLQTISYHDNAENYYHGFASALFVGTSLEVTSNRESGDGRPDLVVADPDGRRGLVLELKHAESEEALESGVQEALGQIAKFRYLDGLPAGMKQRRAYGIAFHKKHCAVRLFR